METLNVTVTKETVNEAVKAINKHRLDNKGRWYQVSINGGECTLKAYNTWVQLCSKPVFHSAMENTPAQFKNNITKGLETLTVS